MSIRFQLERCLFAAFRLSARLIPHRLFLACGSGFGRIAYLLDSRHRGVALENLLVAFPDLSLKERSRLLKKCYSHFGQYLFDMLTCFPRFPSGRMADFEFEGLENLEQVYGNGKGVIFYTGHWGAWELMAMAYGFKGYTVGLIARPLDNPYLHSLLDTLRCSTGNFVIDKKEGFRPMLKALKEGKSIAILIDQNVSTDERIFVDFFGKSAAATPAAGLLHLKTGAPLVSVFALPLGNGRYRFTIGKPLEVPITGDRKMDVQRITQECTRVVEQQIRQYPEYWLWMHRRWKTRPEGETAGAQALPVEESVVR